MALFYIFASIFNIWLNRRQIYILTSALNSVCHNITGQVASKKLQCTFTHKRMRVKKQLAS